MRDQGHVAPVTDFFRDAPVIERVINMAGKNGLSMIHYRREQRRSEWQHGVATRTSAFWKQNNQCAVIESFGDFATRAHHVATFVPADENGACQPCNPPKHRPF